MERDQATKTASCWIASEAGKEFSIVLERVYQRGAIRPPDDQGPRTALGVSLSIDGFGPVYGLIMKAREDDLRIDAVLDSTKAAECCLKFGELDTTGQSGTTGLWHIGVDALSPGCRRCGSSG